MKIRAGFMSFKMAIVFVAVYVAMAQAGVMKALAKNGKRADFNPPNLMISGTKWCGPGNISEHENDLGEFSVEDSCCRTHDRCTTYIASGQKKTLYNTQKNVAYNFTNEKYYTISHCDCDDEFHKCLEDAYSEKGDEIGYWYFQFLDPACLTYDYPLKCTEWTFWFFGPCKCYEPDPSQEKRWYLLKGQYFKDWPDDVDDVCNDPFLQPAL